jgi:hypothetical protein
MRMFIIASLFATGAFAQMPALSPVGGTTLAPAGSLTSFTFVVAGDNRPANATCPQPPQLADVLKGIAAQKPAFVLWDGDVVYGKNTATVASQYPAFLTAIKSAGVPVYVSPGNHEMDIIGQCNGQNVDAPDPSGKMLAAFQTAVGLPYGIFRYGNSAFFSINTDDALGDHYNPTPCNYNGYVGRAQVAALEATLNQLQADATVTNIFVFMHRPLKGEIANDQLGYVNGVAPQNKHIQQVYTLLQSPAYTKLGFVFASHEHLFYAAGTANQQGPFTNATRQFLVTGGAGAPLSKNATSGAYFHYLTVSVNGSVVTATIVPINDNSSNCN